MQSLKVIFFANQVLLRRVNKMNYNQEALILFVDVALVHSLQMHAKMYSKGSQPPLEFPFSRFILALLFEGVWGFCQAKITGLWFTRLPCIHPFQDMNKFLRYGRNNSIFKSLECSSDKVWSLVRFMFIGLWLWKISKLSVRSYSFVLESVSI